MFLLAAFSAAALAGSLDVEVMVGDRVATLDLDGIASCAPFRTSLRAEDDRWSLSGIATATADGPLYLELEVELDARQGRRAVDVRTAPTFLVAPGEEARLEVGGAEEVVTVVVTGAGFDVREGCVPRGVRADRR